VVSIGLAGGREFERCTWKEAGKRREMQRGWLLGRF